MFGLSIISILQMKNLKLRQVKEVIQGHNYVNYVN